MRRKEGLTSSRGLTPSRLEAISDGVIAVIITIMVLELKVPGPDGLAGLRAVMPTIFLYLLTFVQIGIYWVNHHYLVDEAEDGNSRHLVGLTWSFLFLPLAVSVFATDWIGVKGLSSFTTALYAVVSIFPGLAYMAIWILIRRQSAAPAHASWGKQRSHLFSAVSRGCACGLRQALVASLTLIGIVSVIWLLPPRTAAGPLEK